MKQHNTVPLNLRGGKRHAERQAIERQVLQLKEAIKENLIRAGRLAYAGKLDSAIKRHEYVHHQLATLSALLVKAQSLAKLEPVPDNTSNPRKPATKTIVTRKAYKVWSKK